MEYELNPCPHCGHPVRLVDIMHGYAIVCESTNCLGGMRINFGACDNKEIFLAKLISDWNKREPEIPAVAAAINCIEDYRNNLYEEMQEPYDEHGYCCIKVLDEVLNRLQCFTSIAAVKAWKENHNETCNL